MNPYTSLPPDVCAVPPFPAIPVEQDCTSYTLDRAEISGLIILEDGAAGVSEDWDDFEAWEAIFANEQADGTEPKYIVGRGSWLPSESTVYDLAGGRLREIRERVYRLDFDVLNMDSGHAEVARLLQRGKKNFAFWLQTVDGRIIGGQSGLRPSFVNADSPFGRGDERERVSIVLETVFLNLPAWS
jgi:hypothetical protein